MAFDVHPEFHNLYIYFHSKKIGKHKDVYRKILTFSGDGVGYNKVSGGEGHVVFPGKVFFLIEPEIDFLGSKCSLQICLRPENNDLPLAKLLPPKQIRNVDGVKVDVPNRMVGVGKPIRPKISRATYQRFKRNVYRCSEQGFRGLQK